MHYIALLYERTRQSRLIQESVKLRGYHPATWVPSDLSRIRLPVYAIAYAQCPTFRDIYLEFIKKEKMMPTWERYQGRIIDELYKLTHSKCEEYVSRCSSSNVDIYGYLIDKQDEIVAEAKNRHKNMFKQINPQPTNEQMLSLEEGLKKVIRFEAEITSTLVDFEIARVESTNPKRIFNEYFNFNTNLALRAKNQGFTTPAIPDFVYRHELIGDIKSGAWQEFFEYTIVAYALAYEEHIGRDMNYGAILHVQLPQNRLVPAHYEGDIVFLDDSRRNRFIMMRNRKLELLATQIDPGKPDTPNGCIGCGFMHLCWEATK
jgi:CRISPR-associated protein Csa1